MTGKLLQFPEEELCAFCPECDCDCFHLIVGKDHKVVEIECANEDCQWRAMVG